MSSFDWVLVSLGVLVFAGLYHFYRLCMAVNYTDWGHSWVNFINSALRLYCRHFHYLDHTVIDVPKSGPAIVVSNHISGLDPVLLVVCAHRPMRFLVAKEEYERFGLTWMFRVMGCIPVDRKKRPERALREAMQQLKKGEAIALFPHGAIHLDSDPPRRLKPGAARLALMADCPLIPIRITGVRGEGEVMSAIFKRSRVKVTTYPPLYPNGREVNEISDELAAILDGSRDKLNTETPPQ
jgi:1-acyl-sn-glycerol-3-phosphate acyltransferase